MKFSLKKELTDKFPNLQVGLLVATDVDNTQNLDQTYQILWNKNEKRAKEFNKSELKDIPKIQSWLNAFKKVNIDPQENLPSHAAMLQRVINREQIPSINPLVNLYNAQSLDSLLPLGGHDLDKIKGDISVGPNSKKLEFTPINSDQNISITTPANEFVYADSQKVMTRKWVWRQSQKTMTTTETQNILIPIDNLGQYKNKKLQAIATKLKSLIIKYCGTKNTKFKFEIVSSKQPNIRMSEMSELDESFKINIKTHQIKKDTELIDNIINRATEDILPSPKDLKEMLLSGRRLNVYQGFDPTAPTLHIGHTAGMRKLRYFQKLGHNVIFLIGDFTGRVGDPTDKTATRQKLTKEQVVENLQQYKKQASKILDFNNSDNPVKILFNADWLEKLNFADILELTSEFTVQQMIKRDMFKKRLNDEQPIYLHEFLYPVMQAYDSVHMNIDVEVGGNDQMFNMACGRSLTLKLLNKEKIVLPNKLLVDPGGKKMGKSEGNMIMLSDSPKDMYGKVMAFTDSLICPAFELLTDIPMKEIEEMKKAMETDSENPIRFKKKLAFTITAEHKGKKAAQKAQKFFENVYQKKSQTADIPEIETSHKEVSIIKLIADIADFAPSNSQAKRLIKQGAVSINNQKIQDKQHKVTIKKDITLRVGKKIAKIINKS
jgi:tyrosyl-tRNA synthetase